MERLNDEAFAARLAGFLAAAQAKVTEYQSQYDHLKSAAPLKVAGGVKWVKIVNPCSGVYCFINRDTGGMHKAASWSKPVTNQPRSNISDPDFGGSGVFWHGAVYLR